MVGAMAPRGRKIRIGDREMLALGLPIGFWNDLYHRCMTASWRGFIAGALLAFFTLNLLFALVYSLGEAPIANAGQPAFLSLLYFSIETLATVGYGDMHPQSHFGHVVASIESFTGWISMAVITGITFARIARPRARLIFARHPVIGRFEGQPTLMIRVANARHNMISGAAARLWLIHEVRSAEGLEFRRFVELALQRPENPVFALSWTVFHVIDELSPLLAQTPESLAAMEADLVLTINGHDENSGQTMHARQLYSAANIRWSGRYADILEEDADGKIRINYLRFHDVEPA